MDKELIFLEKYMARCLQLARLGEYYVAPNPMVGAVLICPDSSANEWVIQGEGWHRQYGGPHAEVNCFTDAARRGYEDFTQSILFVSLEPCSHHGKTPPCADLIVRHRVKKVVVGMCDPNPLVAGQGIAKLRAAGIEVVVGILEPECRVLNKRFLMLHEHHRPYVTLKWAQTADGYMDRLRDSAHEPVLVISNPITKRLVHKMRAENMAILVGTRTALLDNPGLKNTRWVGRNPIRIVYDRHHCIPAEAKIFSPDAETIVYHDNTDWRFVLSDLAKRGIHSVLVEGGAAVLQDILQSGLYDEIHVEISPQSIGTGVPAPVVELGEPRLKIEGNALYWYSKK